MGVSKKMRWFGVLLSLALLAAAPARAAKDELVIGITQYPSSYHPLIDSMMAKTYVLGMTMRAFTTYDADWKLVCQLCTQLPTVENGLAVPETAPDGKPGIAITYTIQPKATWGDGTPVTTQDVLFTWEVGRHPQSGVASIETFRTIHKIDVKDDKTFTLHLDKLDFDYNAINSFELIPAHVDRPHFSDPVAYKERTAFNTDTTNPGLYFGPYRIASLVSGSHIVLEPNPTWWGEPPAFKRITVRVIENTAALEANLLSGSLDMIAGELGFSIDQTIAFEKRHGEKFNVIYQPGLIYEHIDFNLSNPILADVRVRRALIHGIDRQGMVARLFDGKQSVAHTSVNPLDWVYDPTVSGYAYDPDRAGALLDAAGWATKRNGIRQNAAGEPLRLEIMTTAGNRSRELVQQVLQSQWKALGVDVRIRNEPARVFFGQTVNERRFTAMAMFAWISAPESVPRSTLHSDHIPSAANNWAGQNYTGYSNPEMDRLVEDIAVELNRDKRRALWQQLQRLYAEDAPTIPLYFRSDPYVLPKWLSGLRPTGHQDPSTQWVETWRAH